MNCLYYDANRVNPCFSLPNDLKLRLNFLKISRSPYNAITHSTWDNIYRSIASINWQNDSAKLQTFYIAIWDYKHVVSACINGHVLHAWLFVSLPQIEVRDCTHLQCVTYCQYRILRNVALLANRPVSGNLQLVDQLHEWMEYIHTVVWL